ncbi:FeoA family protein [Sphingobacterium tabacisoli]|uniref:Ferrous iron transport protein A n=1 Tax=Sphingobacterium tabacisoli TaxID=2044855 RepID=A0ABW5L937_9SPHI|nr:FeoA family protein [Sphingobacterium tabacisoli]
MDLISLQKGQQAQIQRIKDECPYEVRQRLLDLGFVHGASIRIQNISPLGDPIAYEIHHTLICLRREDAIYILIEIKEGNDNDE